MQNSFPCQYEELPSRLAASAQELRKFVHVLKGLYEGGFIEELIAYLEQQQTSHLFGPLLAIAFPGQ